MRFQTTDALFAWDKLPDSPDLIALRWLLQTLPDEPLIHALHQHRGKGRDDFPVRLLWHLHLTRYLLRYPTMEACLAELGRNPALRQALGFAEAQPVPGAWNMSRFLEVLGRAEHLTLLAQMFQGLVQRLAGAVEDLGRHLAGDSAALAARNRHRTGAQNDSGTGGQPQLRHVGPAKPDGTGQDTPALPQAAGGRKEYKDDAGTVVQVYEWFGYKFHLLVDIKHEVVVAYHVTSAAGAGTGDSSVLPILLAKAQRVLPAGRVQTVAYDKAADDAKSHELLHGEGIKPVIQIRSLLKDELEKKLPGHDGNSNVVYDEAGTLYCYDTVSPVPVKHQMGYVGYERERGTLKYRCPARHEGWDCPSDKQCNGSSSYGKTARVKCEWDLRRFPPIPRATAEFERRYKGRTAIERVNARVKIFWGADDGNVTGAERFHAHLATIMVVHATLANWLAVQPRYEGKSLSPTRMSQLAQRLAKAAAKPPREPAAAPT